MSRLEREIIAQKNDDVFKSGIGDIDDLKILADYDRAHTENFQIGLTLAGHTLEKARCTQNLILTTLSRQAAPETWKL